MVSASTVCFARLVSLSDSDNPGGGDELGLAAMMLISDAEVP